MKRLDQVSNVYVRHGLCSARFDLEWVASGEWNSENANDTTILVWGAGLPCTGQCPG